MGTETEITAPGNTMKAIDALGGFFRLAKRSPLLDGTLQMRAAQFCPPVWEGNMAGVQVLLPHQIVVGLTGKTLAVNVETELPTGRKLAHAVGALVRTGLIESDGYWHERLKKAVLWVEGGHLRIWTGLIVRPDEGLWLHSGGAYNRRCPAPVIDVIYPDSTRYTPLVIDLDLRILRKTTSVALRDEVACLLPLRPDATFKFVSLEEEGHDLGSAFNRYFSPEWRKTQSQQVPDEFGRVKPTAAYRRLIKSDPLPSARGVTLPIVALTKARGDIDVFRRFATADGVRSHHPESHRLHFVMLRSHCAAWLEWDGYGWRDKGWGETSRAWRQIENRWARIYGDEFRASISIMAEFLHTNPPGDDHFAIHTRVLVGSPPGWSCIDDGWHFEPCEGMRGVISTDQYPLVPPIYRVLRPGRIRIAKGAPLERLLPVPREVLQGGFSIAPLSA